jgi:hypothetical protein
VPGPNFYRDAGDSSADFIYEFVDHHADPKTRHISKYEARRLTEIAALLHQQETPHGPD